MTALATGMRAPDFRLTSIDGQDCSLHPSSPQLTLLIFFKNSCPTCNLSLPYLQRLYERVREAPLGFWGISQDSASDTRTHAEEHGLTFPLLSDASGFHVSQAYRLTHVPALFLIEASGTVAWTSRGFVKADLEGLDLMLQRRFRLPGVAPLFHPADSVPALQPG